MRHLRIVSGSPLESQEGTHGFRGRDSSPRAWRQRPARAFRNGSASQPSVLGVVVLIFLAYAAIVLSTGPDEPTPQLDSREWATDAPRSESP